MRDFAQLTVSAAIPEGKTIMNFPHLLVKHL